ncbi:hypothetical protein Micbo1qcDRAFT_214329 [Microdochium bolleyi]|uniref:Uncharacterized protein n=1 Tax=Microdochium bolleyi TaxID=196109 RepID=A0A136IUF3_9PEZI|nr:hypothetical protein Micbo1qcDRAFT_214329 [Microdochium bolleyi]
MGSTDKVYDLAVIGTGVYGLAAAKAHIDLQPEQSLIVLEAEATCGGTWSKARLYPGLRSNNIWGSYEYPDYPMAGDKYGLEEGQHIPGDVQHRYYTDYAKHFGIFERIRFNTRVLSAEATPSGSWRLTTSPTTPSGPSTSIFIAHKLIVASGLTSQPNMPCFRGQDSFTSPLFHGRDFCKRGALTNTSRRAVVIGGGKSAFDVVYAFASSPACTEGVDMLIRPSGSGPVWMSYPYVTPFKRKIESLVFTRLLTWFSPCAWGDEDGFGAVRWFLQATLLGRLLVRLVFAVMSMDVAQAVGYDSHPELKKLKPWHSAFWEGSGLGIWNFPTSFVDLVKTGKIRVHLAEVDRLDGKTVFLDNGVQIDTDVLVCATGWKHRDSSLSFINFDTGLRQKGAEREGLFKKADRQLLNRFPILRNQPELRPEQIHKREHDRLARGKAGPGGPEDDNGDAHEPARLYRFIVPSQGVASRNIAFAGRVSPISTAICAHVQGLWIQAFFDGRLARGPPATEGGVVDEIVLHTQFEKWRYPCGYGPVVPDMAFDSIPYVDLLMNDLGLSARRKGSMLREVFQAYGPRDYEGVLGEYRVLQEK